MRTNSPPAAKVGIKRDRVSADAPDLRPCRAAHLPAPEMREIGREIAKANRADAILLRAADAARDK